MRQEERSSEKSRKGKKQDPNYASAEITDFGCGCGK
jgi:hypothetical protein